MAAVFILGIAFIRVQAQTDILQTRSNIPLTGSDIQQTGTGIPKGFKKGRVIMDDSAVVSGYIKDDIRSHASVCFINGKDGKKQELNGGQIQSLEIDGTRFICVKGDFFKVLAEGRICFLQKSSDASDKPSYNGTDAVYINGTDGIRGDYFIYDPRHKSLKLVTRKSYVSVVSETFSGCTAAIEKANAPHTDMNGMKEAVLVYNNLNR